MVSCRLSQGSSAIRNLHTGWESETSGERTVQAVQGSRLGRFVSTNKMGAKTCRSVKKNQMAMRRSLRYGNSRIDMASYGVIIAQKNGLISTFVQVWVSENVRIMKTIPVGVCYCISMHGYMG